MHMIVILWLYYKANKVFKNKSIALKGPLLHAPLAPALSIHSTTLFVCNAPAGFEVFVHAKRTTAVVLLDEHAASRFMWCCSHAAAFGRWQPGIS
jgi:hypothetical protein